MRNFINISIIAVSLSLIGCSDDAQKTPATPKATPTAPVVDDSHANIATGTSEKSTTITVAGNTFKVMVKGSIAPNAVLDVSIVQSSGVPAAAIRVWVGDESGVGSMKTKAHSHGASSHVHAEAPSKLPANSALWIEVQNADGTSGSGSIQLD